MLPKKGSSCRHYHPDIRYICRQYQARSSWTTYSGLHCSRLTTGHVLVVAPTTVTVIVVSPLAIQVSRTVRLSSFKNLDLQRILERFFFVSVTVDAELCDFTDPMVFRNWHLATCSVVENAVYIYSHACFTKYSFVLFLQLCSCATLSSSTYRLFLLW